MTVSEACTAISDAIRRQYGTTDKHSLGDMPNGLHFTPTVKDGKQHVIVTTKISDLPVKSIESIKLCDELTPGCRLKVTNIGMTINPL